MFSMTQPPLIIGENYASKTIFVIVFLRCVFNSCMFSMTQPPIIIGEKYVLKILDTLCDFFCALFSMTQSPILIIAAIRFDCLLRASV